MSIQRIISSIIYASVESKLKYLFENNPKVVKAFMDKWAYKLPEQVRSKDIAFYSVVQDKIVKELPFDDSRAGTYTLWIITRMVKDDAMLLEDIPYKIGDALKLFDELKKKVQNKTIKIDGFRSDINSFKSFDELEAYLEPFEDKDRRDYGKLLTPEALGLIHDGDASIHYKSGAVTVVALNTFKASAYFSTGTKWCTSSESMFDSYQKWGKLYVIFTPEGKFQFHLHTNQYMNDKDKAINIQKFLEKYPEVLKAFANKSIVFIDNPNESELHNLLTTSKSIESLFPNKPVLLKSYAMVESSSMGNLALFVARIITEISATNFSALIGLIKKGGYGAELTKALSALPPNPTKYSRKTIAKAIQQYIVPVCPEASKYLNMEVVDLMQIASLTPERQLQLLKDNFLDAHSFIILKKNANSDFSISKDLFNVWLEALGDYAANRSEKDLLSDSRFNHAIGKIKEMDNYPKNNLAKAMLITLIAAEKYILASSLFSDNSISWGDVKGVKSIKWKNILCDYVGTDIDPSYFEDFFNVIMGEYSDKFLSQKDLAQVIDYGNCNLDNLFLDRLLEYSNYTLECLLSVKKVDIDSLKRWLARNEGSISSSSKLIVKKVLLQSKDTSPEELIEEMLNEKSATTKMESARSLIVAALTDTKSKLFKYLDAETKSSQSVALLTELSKSFVSRDSKLGIRSINNLAAHALVRWIAENNLIPAKEFKNILSYSANSAIPYDIPLETGEVVNQILELDFGILARAMPSKTAANKQTLSYFLEMSHWSLDPDIAAKIKQIYGIS